MSDDNWFSSAASSPYLPIVAGLFRGGVALAAGGGWMYAKTVSGDQATMAATVALGAGMMMWSALQKVRALRKARRAEVAAALASARVGVPVTVIETPKGQDNIAARVPPTEAVLAPSVPVDAVPIPASRP